MVVVGREPSTSGLHTPADYQSRPAAFTALKLFLKVVVSFKADQDEQEVLPTHRVLRRSITVLVQLVENCQQE